MTKDLHLSWTKTLNKEESDRQYLDYIVSGQPLREYLGLKTDSSVTPFGYFPNKEEQKRALREFRLQQKTQLSEERVQLYVCACCGDIGCGAITVKIIDKGEKIIWTQFGTQSDPEEVSEIFNVPDLEFDRVNYFKAFSSIV